MDVDEWESWPWYRQHESACVTVVRGLGIDDVVELWPVRPLTPLHDADETAEWPDYDDESGDVRGVIVMGLLGSDALFIWELDGGFEASRPQVLAALSSHGSACVNYWNDVNCTPVFGFAVEGRVVRVFTTDDPAMSYGEEVDQPLPDEADLVWPLLDDIADGAAPEGDGRASALQLQSRLMKAAQADPSWLELTGLRWFGTPFGRDALARQEP